MITAELASRIDGLAADRVPCVLATVVRARHPTSVRPGDCALVLGDGSIEGFVGGTCAQASVRMHALRALETGEPLLLRLVPGDEEGADPSDTGQDAVVIERNPCLSGGSLEIFLEPRLPPPLIVVVGDAPIAQALERLAAAAGYDAVRGGERAGADRNATAVIVASHGAGEEQVLAEALTSGVPYVALVASRLRGEAVRAALEVPEELRSQLHTPAGLDIGARTPVEIAISILAQLVAEQHAAPGERKATSPPQVATAIDPVCGMRIAVGDATPQLGNEFFCSEHCREAYAGQHDVATP